MREKTNRRPVSEITDKEIEEFEKYTDAHEGNEMCGGYALNEIASMLPVEWDRYKKRRFIKWFLLKGIKEGWIYSDLGFE